ncbi:MAG: DUF1385 domain-containing protein [Ruminococcaceae bacterium]|nr:DUF1385 domain-containing protein [Oscillospiraceae bacterium]
MSNKNKDTQKACRLKTSIGGQALIEGIMMRGPKMTAMAVRNPEGEIVLEKWPTEVKKKAKIITLPFIRGIFNFVDTLRFGYKCLMRSAEIAGLDEFEENAASDKTETTKTDAEQSETVAADVTADETAGQGPVESKDNKEEKKEETSMTMNIIMTISTVLAFGLAFLLFFWLPSQLYVWMPDSVFAPDNRFLKSAFEAIMRVLLLVGYMSAVALMKDIRRTYMLHGAEHKTIFCYEAGLELTVENIRTMRRFHPRCGTSFLIIMVLVSMIVGFFIPPTLPTILRVLIKVALIPLIVGIGYELIKLAGRHDNWFTRIISAPGLLLQRLTVFEPDDDMIECAITAMKEVIPEDGSDKF